MIKRTSSYSSATCPIPTRAGEAAGRPTSPLKKCCPSRCRFAAPQDERKILLPQEEKPFVLRSSEGASRSMAFFNGQQSVLVAGDQ